MSTNLLPNGWVASECCDGDEVAWYCLSDDHFLDMVFDFLLLGGFCRDVEEDDDGSVMCWSNIGGGDDGNVSCNSRLVLLTINGLKNKYSYYSDEKKSLQIL